VIRRRQERGGVRQPYLLAASPRALGAGLRSEGRPVAHIAVGDDSYRRGTLVSFAPARLTPARPSRSPILFLTSPASVSFEAPSLSKAGSAVSKTNGAPPCRRSSRVVIRSEQGSRAHRAIPLRSLLPPPGGVARPDPPGPLSRWNSAGTGLDRSTLIDAAGPALPSPPHVPIGRARSRQRGARAGPRTPGRRAKAEPVHRQP